MAFKDPERKKAYQREYMRDRSRLEQREKRGFKRGDRPQIFASIPQEELDKLSPSERAIIIGYYRDMKSLEAIATELDCTRQNVGKRKDRLEKILGIKKDSENS